MVDKVTGQATFGIDVAHDDMLYATIKMNPNLGGSMLSYDDSEAKKMRGVKHIFAIEDKGVAVVATNTWYAFKAAEKIVFEWQKASYPDDTDGLFLLRL